MLAMLLLHANRVVTVPQLVAAAWDDDPPATARRQVVNRVAALRTGLRRFGGRIDTFGSGYRLRVGPDELDALRFERMVVGARNAQDPAESARMLRAALALWTGPALAGLDGTLVGRGAMAWNEARVAALGDCIDCELAANGEASLVPELYQLVVEHPTDERFVGQLMVALCRTGRPGEALEALRSLRERLVDELGIEPGEQLRKLQLAVLNGEITPPAQPPQAEPAPARPVAAPRQLPVDVAAFTGRQRELAEIDAVMVGGAQRGMAVLAVEGVGGIGKSALAIHAAHRIADRFPDGQLYVDLQGFTPGLEPLTPHEVLSRFLRALNVKSSDIIQNLAEMAAQFRSLTASRRLLIVLDNARDAAQVAILLPNSPASGVMVTSRRLLTALEGASHLKLDVLSPPDAVAQLSRIVGRLRVNADPAAAAEVAQWCGRLPLALRIAGARIAARPTWSMRVLADRLRDAQVRLDELELSDFGVRASLAMSHEELRTSGDPTDLAAAAALATLSLFDGSDLGTDAAAALLDESLTDTDRILERLVDANLLETPAYGRYRLHDLVRLYAHECVATSMTDDQRIAALQRVFRAYAATAWRAFELLRPGDQRPSRASIRDEPHAAAFSTVNDALSWLEDEYLNMISAVVQAADRRFAPQLCIELTQALYAFFRIRGYWPQVLVANQAILPVTRRAGDRRAEATACNDIGVALCQHSRWAAASVRLHEALTIYRELHDDYGEGQTLNNLGVVHQMMGRLHDALDVYGAALAVHVRSANPRGQGMSLGNLGAVHRDLGQYDDAMSCHAEALTIFESLDDRFGQAVELIELGTLYARIRSFDQSMTCLRRSLAVCRDMGDRFGEAQALKNIGAVLREQTRHPEALQYQEQSLAIYRELGRRDGEVDNLRELGLTFHALGRREQAQASLRKADALLAELHGGEPLTLAETSTR
jgi:DNA-binding SARP family transcriptional activator/tetratricopeptide (TPR) repeat protein